MWWIAGMIIVLFLSVFLPLVRRIFLPTIDRKATRCPEIDILTLVTFYLPVFLIQGFIPAILSARKHYGCSFCLHIPGMKRRIYFLTGSHGRHAISRNLDLRLPAAQVARVFGISEQTTEIFFNNEYIHEFGSAFQGVGLKDMTRRHSINLQKIIRECLVSDQTWREIGLYDLCSMLVYESMTTTLYGSNFDARSIVKELKTLDKDVHLLAYPSPFRWFKPDLIRAKDKIAERLSSTNLDDPESIFASKANKFPDTIPKEDIGHIKSAILWASYGNTIPAIFWTYFYLRRDPKVHDIILQEITSTPSSTPQLDSAIEETMRLTANALVVRECARDAQLNDGAYDISLSENDILLLFPFASQIDEEYFPHPHEFIYDRFLLNSPNEASAHARRVHAPFGEGKFICPGRYLGKNVTKLTIIALLTQFDIEFLDREKTPQMLKSRHGFGIPPPRDDLPIRYRIKSDVLSQTIIYSENHTNSSIKDSNDESVV